MDSQNTESRTFNPQAYINRWYNEPSSNSIFYKWMKQAFDRIPNCEWAIEIGCGPILILSAFASKKANNILLTEYNTECFKWIDAWIKDQKNSAQFYDWLKFYDVLAEVQGEGSGVTIAEQVRRSVKACIKIDLTKESIFEYPVFVKADFIVSSLCLEAAAPTQQDYKKNMRKIVKYLNPKGFIFLLGVLEETFYTVFDQRLPCLPLTKDLVINTLKENGLSIIFYESQEEKTQDDSMKIGYDASGFFAVLAQYGEQ